jgi:hypothetical protein
MTARYTSAFSRRDAPELCRNDPPKEGVALPQEGAGATPRRERGMPGAHRARSLACKIESTRVSHHGHAGSSGIPRATVLTGCSALSLVTGLVCHHRPQEALLLEDLTPASGRQDHTSSPSARQRSRQPRRPRPSHPCPTFVTIAKRPFVWAGMAEGMEVIWVGSEQEYFCGEDWTTQISLIAQEKFSFARKAHGRFVGRDNRHVMV